MRMKVCVPMMLLCLLLSGCGTEKKEDVNLRDPYQTMEGCQMEAVVRCSEKDLAWEATMRCTYLPEESRVEVVQPETLAGVRAVVRQDGWQLEYEELCLDIGPLSQEEISPVLALPRLMEALRSGWLLEENRETWQDEPCLRLMVDQTGEQGGKIYSTIWLKEADGTPLRGEITVDGAVILTIEFTAFEFCDTMQFETMP